LGKEEVMNVANESF